jgi:hypothetical protein
MFMGTGGGAMKRM